jgi:hypothetical protein
MVLQDEANLRLASEMREQAGLKRLRGAVLEGLWDEVTQLAKTVKPAFIDR